MAPFLFLYARAIADWWLLPIMAICFVGCIFGVEVRITSVPFSQLLSG